MKHKHVMLSVLMFIVVLLGAAGDVSAQSLNLDFGGAVAVSYTHLTLPTKA